MEDFVGDLIYLKGVVITPEMFETLEYLQGAGPDPGNREFSNSGLETELRGINSLQEYLIEQLIMNPSEEPHVVQGLKVLYNIRWTLSKFSAPVTLDQVMENTMQPF